MIKNHWALHRNCKKRIQSESEENWRSAAPDESRALNDENDLLPEIERYCEPSGKWKKSGERRREKKKSQEDDEEKKEKEDEQPIA